MDDLIKSISYSNAEIIQNILDLHVPSHRIDCDCTYSKGLFYKGTGLKEPKYKFDIHPQTPDTIRADSRSLPLPNQSVDCILFDPPFLATTGPSLSNHNSDNLMAHRFGVYPSERDLFQFYRDSLKEFYRCLSPHGILIFKCQDKVSSGTQFMSHCIVYNQAIDCGFYPKDLFILLAKSRLVANWQRNQKHARKYHCYFWVLQKNSTRLRKIQFQIK